MRKSFTFYKQRDKMDCGPTCLRMIAKFYGKNLSIQGLRETCEINREGVSMLGISMAAEKIGFKTEGLRIIPSEITSIDLPVILHWEQNHFVVLYKIKNNTFYIADPAKGLIQYSLEEFKSNWISSKNKEGILLTFSPTESFYNLPEDKDEGINFRFLFKYLYKHKQLLIQLFIGLGIGSILQLIVPFLTQSIVDVGIATKNLDFIYIILVAQIMLFLGRISVDFIRSWILLHVSTRINISILIDFLIKLMKLPLSFFDTKVTGDIMQRMNDQKRIESFLTGSTLTIIFSFFNLIVFAFVLIYYDINIFLVFLTSSVLYTFWVIAFLKRRRKLDFERFDISAKNQNSMIQLIHGMQEIKLNNCEDQKRWEWERIQASLFKFNIKSLSLSQTQQVGSFILNEGKNIIITFLVARSVVYGELTLGEMMATQYIVGQLNSPIEQFLSFTQSLQEAKISLERINEIHQMSDEEPSRVRITDLPVDHSISLENLSFTYPGAGNEPVLNNINLKIPVGKTTAIVGMSGSGKTTILKLLLRFYKPNKGNIKVGDAEFEDFSFKYWRSKCGVVMQDGYMFSDTIARNIAVADEIPDPAKLKHAIEVANIRDLIERLPLGLETKIGVEGNGISQGQKQRILIARAVYKDPDFIFFDEATNALDANNESIIMNNLEKFFKGRTVVIVAHRLSTVKNAANIILLEEGNIIEEGTHTELIAMEGQYFKLVKNQLELN